MKRIRIYQENAETLEIFDEDNSHINEYTQKLSSILESPTITILETTTGNNILRPHKIVSIKVTEEKKENSEPINNIPPESPINKEEDYVEDASKKETKK